MRGHRAFIVWCTAVILSAAPVFPPSAEETGIAVYFGNPCYWSYDGAPVLLLGGSDEDNLFNHPAMMRDNLDTLARIGGNYIRGTLSWRDEGNVPPFESNGSVYDLDRFNQEFFDRLDTCIREAAARDIVVQIELWATFDYYLENWLINPFNPKNNSNYTTENTRLVTEWEFHPAQRPQPFFYSVPAQNNDTMLLRYQEAFARKVLDVTLPYNNVLYSIDNETRAPAEWALYWGRFIGDYARSHGKTALVTEMWDQWNITHPDHETTYENPAIFPFTDVSQNNWQDGDTHYERLLWYRSMLSGIAGGPRPVNNVKVYARLSGNRPNDYGVGVERWWRNIFAGCASTRFHRPPSGSGLDDTAQTMIHSARVFTSAYPHFTTRPAPELLRDRGENEAFCLADPGSVYALYFPRGGDVTLDVPAGQTWRVRWFDVETGVFSDSGKIVRTGKTLKITTPAAGIGLCLVETTRK